MVRSRAAQYAPLGPSWVSDIVRYWPIVVTLLGLIGYVIKLGIVMVNSQRDVVELKQNVSMNGKQLVVVVARQDTLTKNAEVRDYMICKVFETLVQKQPGSTKIPKRCDDVFQGWGP